MKFASSRDNTSEPFGGARTEPVFGDCEGRDRSHFTGLNARADSAGQVQSEMPNLTFFSEVPAARGPNFDDYADTEQSNWLKERSNPSL
ncbi:hypothetical protein [Mesorhizobium sp.]|uniref:hypothetical protein n=1 Tax=Mesorhizobium sp. TaxID=1871066 RepID=UPI000FE54356|nr:hypothetical protein [Mesorhizobium sp.]RWI08768.1 MAG: hypothetical protein EOQ90_16990 [Mesorhizobium sp.]RWM85789.1 MAG: hypothetical protein EOR83_11055 [Mesorhizobium sp.]